MTPLSAIFLASLSSGFASAVLGSTVLVREISCRAQGHEYCQFEGRTVSDWGLRSEDIQKRYDLNPLEEELAQLNAALGQARENLYRQNAEISRLRLLAQQIETDEEIICRSNAMSRLLALAIKVSPTRSSVLIQGESGVGKEVMARFIHRRSLHSHDPFLAINCAALPPGLLESELFGHVKGAFTGADTDKKGLFAEAGEGTLFLDEVAELTPELQAKLLRALQEKEVRPVGGLTVFPVRARIVSASNRDLREMISQGKFREDLYYRLAVFPLFICPLRELREDILILARHFLSKLNKDSYGISPAALRCMETYHWPGNVRELSNWVEYAVILAGCDRIMPEHLPLHMSTQPTGPLPILGTDQPTLEELEKRYIRMVLQNTGNRRNEAAKKLGISTATLWRRLQQQ
jgi:two-component system, NtrC family, response regulator HydG